MSTPLTILPDVTVGNEFQTAFQITDTTQNFTNVQVTASLALSLPPYTNPSVQFVPVVTFPIAGNNTTFIVTLTLNGSQTANLGVGTYIGDVVLTMAGYGPYSVVGYTFNIIQGITLNSIYTGGLAIVNLTGSNSLLIANAVNIITGLTTSTSFALPTVTGSGQCIVVKNQSPYAITITGNMFTTSAVTTYIINGSNATAQGTCVTLINDGNFTNNNGYWNTISPNGS